MSAHTPPSGPSTPGACLDWRAASHWSYARLECVYCQARTNLRDSAGRPCHKTCAEAALDAAAENTGVGAQGLDVTGAAA